MRELIKELVENLINPKKKEQKKLDLQTDLALKFEKSLYLKDYLNSKAYQEFDRIRIYNSLESGITSLIRDGLKMTENEIKMILADMRANIYKIDDMRYAIDEGEKAGIKLEKLK